MTSPDVLEINKDLLPYTCNIQLAGEIFTLHFNYNATAELFTIDLYRDNELICAGEPIVYGKPLWSDVYRAGIFPAVEIIPKNQSGGSNAVTFDNLGQTVLMIVDNGEGEASGE
jgi:hypothetical protein